MRLVRILPAVLALVCVTPAFAQDNPPGPDGGGNRRGGGRGGFGNMSLVDQLKPVLNLTDDQVTKLKPIDDQLKADMQKARDEMRNNQGDGGGPPDFTKMRETMTAIFKKATDQVKPILTDDQKPKFDEWLKQQEERRNQFGGGRGGPGGGRGPSDKELTDRAEKELTLTADEKAAVMPLVKKVLEARAEARKNNETRKEELKKFMKDVPGTTDAQREEIATKLKELKKARESDESKVKDAENALREVLTPENEAKCVVIGIL